MPTGVALADPRRQLFAAAERVLLRAGPSGLTSRAVTAEAGVAKGVLHRHFADFDAFLMELIQVRVAEVEAQHEALWRLIGTGAIAANVTAALCDLFDPLASAMLVLFSARDGLRAALAAAGLRGIPVISQGTAMIADYLAAEQRAGRLAADADIDVLAMCLVGTAHLIAAGQLPPPDLTALPPAVEKILGPVER